MAFWKGVLFFKAGDRGWTEQFYFEAESAQDRDLALKMTRLANARRDLLHEHVYIEFDRISNVDNARDARFDSYTPGEGQGRQKGGSGSADPESVETAANVRLFAGEQTWRSYLIRGLPDSYITVDAGGQSLTQAFRDTMREYFRIMTRESVRLRKRNYGGAVVIQQLGFSGTTLQSVTTAAPIPGVNAGDRIQIRRGVGVVNLNREYRVARIDPGNVYVLLPTQVRIAGTLEAGTAEARKVEYTYPALTDWEPIGVTRRSTGRPSHKPRGRRSVRRG